MKKGSIQWLTSAVGKVVLNRACLPALLTLLTAAAAVQAQTVTMYGTLSNFDVINDTGEPAHGFEIEIHGMTSLGGTFTYNRYGASQITPFPGGMYVRYLSPWDPATQQFMVTTPVAVHPTVTNGHQCTLGSFGYDTSGCEHFGVWSFTSGTGQTIYRWLVADPANPGQLKAAGSQVAIPAPVWSVVPPVAPADPVAIVAQVDPPIPPPPAKQYGPAQWMKTYKTENDRQVGLDELVADNPVVPQDEAHLETAWDLMQNKIGDVGNSKQKQKRGALGGRSHAVVRRFEFYKFTGTIDPVTGQAICADGLCAAPAADEIGDFLGAQNAAVNLNVPVQYPVTVTVSGDGAVSSSDAVIRCPAGACSESVNPHTSVTLTAKAGKGVFSGWSGACAGKALNCTIIVDSEAPVTATFLTPYKLVLKTSGTGTVSANPGDTTLPQGTVVTLTATPAAGATFTGWTGGCSGTSLTCAFTINADTTVTATFSGIVAPPPPATYRLVVKTNGSGAVSSNPSGSNFAGGSSVTVTAVPGASATWKGWTGATCSGLSLSCTFTMTADTTVTANFR
ncbi:MAG: hypothetical protein JWO80_2603 [Bryobacterales bacterium]|nr:hypothetical protein [Bryobacterales bacterium]